MVFSGLWAFTILIHFLVHRTLLFRSLSTLRFLLFGIVSCFSVSFFCTCLFWLLRLGGWTLLQYTPGLLYNTAPIATDCL